MRPFKSCMSATSSKNVIPTIYLPCAALISERLWVAPLHLTGIFRFLLGPITILLHVLCTFFAVD